MSQNDLLAEIKQFIPEDKFDIFSERIGVAIELYQDIDEPKQIKRELKEINRIAKKPNYTLVNVMKNISGTTIEILERLSPLPTLPEPSDINALSSYASDIRKRIVRGSVLYSDRVHNVLVGPSEIGRPSKRRVDVLVAFVAAAYVSATGGVVRRQWDSDSDSDSGYATEFHEILMVIFVNLGIKASIDGAIRRHSY